MHNHASILIPGKDARSRCCADALAALGYKITDCPPAQADVIVLPIGIRLPQELAEDLRPGQLVLGGCLESSREQTESAQFRIIDYYDDPILRYANAVPTAEGAIAILMERTQITIQGMHCLITGYGRIGTVLAQKLALLGAKVTVSARSNDALGAIYAMGLRPERTGQYRYPLSEYDAVINTVPAAVFSDFDYGNFKEDCLLLEVASAPGGISETRCRDRNLSYVRAPGLPGRFAPKTAGHAIAQAIHRILEREVSPCGTKP